MWQFLTVFTYFAVFATVTQAQGPVVRKTIVHDGIERTYNVYVPSTYSSDNATPLVLNLHGGGGNADQQMASSAMNAVAEENGFLVAYPNAIDGSWDRGSDLSFIDSLLHTIESEYAVDSARVYSTGWSQGGIMSYDLAATRPEVFAAIAPVAGYSQTRNVPNRPFPVMHIHGTDDVVVTVDGSTSVFGTVRPLIDDFLTETAAANGCSIEQTQTELPNISPDDDSTVSVLSFEECDTYTAATGDKIVASVLYYRVNGGGHSWPVLDADRATNLTAIEETFGSSVLPAVLPLNSDFHASAAIWEFFEGHVAPVPEPGALPLTLLGLLALAKTRRRRNRTPA